MSVLMPDRWAFEAAGHDLGIHSLLLHGGSPLGPPLVATYGHAGVSATGVYWAVMLAFAVVFFVAAWVVLRRRCRPAGR